MPPRKSKKKQTRLAFAASTASPPANVSPEQSSRYATLTYDNPSLGTYRPPKSLKSKPETSPEKKRPKLPAKKRSKDKPAKDQSGDGSLHEPTIPATQKRKKAAQPDNLDLADPDEPQDAKESLSRKPQRSLQFSKAQTENKDDSDSEELSRPRRTLKRKAESSPIDSDSDDPVASSVAKRRRSTRGGNASSPPVILSDDDSNESVRPSTAKRRRVARPATVSKSDDDDSDEPLASSPVKRLRRGQEKETPKAPTTPRHISKQDKLDIAEDLEDLQDSVVKKSRTRGRNVESARDKRMKHLEALRRRRAGVKDEEEGEEEDDDDEDEDEYDSDVQEIKRPGSDGSPSGRGLWRHHDDDSDIESNIDPNENLDRYEDDFVLEDEVNDLGVPTEEIPFEFTRHAYKQPKEYFRDVIGWMVQNKLNPAFPRSDDMYKMAFMKLEDEVKGRAGSQLISSVWNPSFVYALQARPHIDISAFPTEENHPCDACRRSGHPASSDIKLYGKAYSLQTLEPLEDDNDDSDDSDEDSKHNDGKDRDRDGHVIPPENVRYYLGKQCKARAQLAHTLTHWRYHLNEWVIDYLERTGHMDDDEILRRNDMSVKRKTRNANDVLDSMTGTGEVDKLWRDFHINLKSAREKESIYG
ncbi:hypothetical protein N7524_009144 [Penicillium chrysogenum]|nr:hypothetical protein N7524_009144 [Penicillium chrysogenum]